MFDLSLLNDKEKAVYCCIAECDDKITQNQIAKHERWLGIHEKFESHLPIPDKRESTLRQIRQIIHDLRMKHDAPILSDINGYWIAKGDGDVGEYIQRLEAVAKAQSRSWLETYRHMKNIFGDDAQSDYFESQQKLF